jgi:hypothetical protein
MLARNVIISGRYHATHLLHRSKVGDIERNWKLQHVTQAKQVCGGVGDDELFVHALLKSKGYLIALCAM